MIGPLIRVHLDHVAAFVVGAVDQDVADAHPRAFRQRPLYVTPFTVTVTSRTGVGVAIYFAFAFVFLNGYDRHLICRRPGISSK